MSRTWRIYYNIVFGGLGGLLAWLFVGSLPDLIQNAIFWELLTGAVAGSGIGALLGAVDGALGKRFGRMILGVGRGGILGFVGGILGLAIGEGLFLLTQGGFIGRSIGWGLVGAIVGTTEGIANRAPRKISYGVLGGILGGLVGGALFEGLTQAALTFTPSGATFDPKWVTWMQAVAAGIGLVLVGACIGSFIALVEQILVSAWLKVIRGKQEGKDFNVVKSVMTIGGDDRNDIPLYDPSVGQRVAVLRQHGKDIRIESAEGTVALTRAGSKEPLSVATPQTLVDGDKVLVGNTLLLFRQRK
jgi:hypothetical protein